MNPDPHILIATPSYLHNVSLDYHLSSLEMGNYMRQCGIAINELHYSKDGLISRVRSGLLSQFIAQEQFTHIMWIDNDLRYSWEDIPRLVEVNREFVCGVYRKRCERLEFPCVYMQDPRLPFKLDEKGCIPLRRAPGGFCMWKRSAVERMIRAYPERRCKIADGGWFEGDNAHAYDFFPCPVDETGMLQSEDYGFCDLFREAGGEISCLVDIELIHAGYRGRLSDCLRFEREEAA